MAARITAAIDSGLEGADDILTEAQTLIDRETAQLAASARRRAVLQGLAELGYEVRDTMETAWVRDGRLVVRKPNATDYAVEVAAPAEASRLQVRLVGSDRPASPRDARRDCDMETIWCSEFAQLQQLLATRGGEVIIERAAEAGVQPVKTVPLVEADREIHDARQHVMRRQ